MLSARSAHKRGLAIGLKARGFLRSSSPRLPSLCAKSRAFGVCMAVPACLFSTGAVALQLRDFNLHFRDIICRLAADLWSRSPFHVHNWQLHLQTCAHRKTGFASSLLGTKILHRQTNVNIGGAVVIRVIRKSFSCAEVTG